MTVTAQDIRVAMLKQFGGAEWAIMWEVAQATGYSSGKTRYADAVMMSLWPSRGLHLHGVEIKVSRSDWKREAADPAKAERIAAYCDFWWVHVAPGVIADLSEVPLTWGVREFDGKKWSTRREATKTDALPVDRGFLASLLRRAEGREEAAIEDAVQKRVNAAVEVNEERIRRAVDEKTRHNSDALKIIEAFEAASGISMSQRWDSNAAQIGWLVKLAEAVGVENLYIGIKGLVNTARITSEQLTKALEEFDAQISLDVKDAAE